MNINEERKLKGEEWEIKKERERKGKREQNRVHAALIEDTRKRKQWKKEEKRKEK